MSFLPFNCENIDCGSPYPPPPPSWHGSSTGRALHRSSFIQLLFIYTAGNTLRACLHGGGGPQVGEVTCDASPHLSCKRDQIKMTDYMNRRITQPKRVTSPTWVPPTPCKQALTWKPFFRSYEAND